VAGMSIIFLQDNKFLPIKPIQATQVDTMLKGGIAITKQKRELSKSVVLMDGIAGTKKGSVVYLRPEAGFAPWNKEIWNIGDIEFVMAPLDFVIGIETNG
jgi:hypothetical protein